MKLFTLFSSAAITCVISAAAASVYYYYCYKKTRNKVINDILEFHKPQFNPRMWWSVSFAERNNLQVAGKLINYIETAQTSIKMCMPLIHNPTIQSVLLKLMKEKNIKLCIIIERNELNSSLEELIDAGAEIKCRVNNPYSVYEMNHNVCLIDDKLILLGAQAIHFSWLQWCYIYVTSQPDISDLIKRDFSLMWSEMMDLQEAIQIDPQLFYE